MSGAGATLFALSRNGASQRAVPAYVGHRKPITLSTKPLSPMPQPDHDIDDEPAAEAASA